MTPEIEALATMYDRACADGQKRIRDRWPYLSAPTKRTLVSSGRYSTQGHRSEGEAVAGLDAKIDVEDLEYCLGVFARCLSAKIPGRHEMGTPIPVEVATDEVLTACDRLLFVPAWRDPEVIRLAIGALAAHQQANALTFVGPETSTALAAITVLGNVVKAGLALLAPMVGAYGVVSAVEHDMLGAVIGFYLLAIGLSAANSLKRTFDKERLTPQEQSYRSWSAFRHQPSGFAIGDGARFKFEQMAKEGANVPAVAFDLCGALTHAAQSDALRAVAAQAG